MFMTTEIQTEKQVRSEKADLGAEKGGTGVLGFGAVRCEAGRLPTS